MKNMWIELVRSIQRPSPEARLGVLSSPTIRSPIERRDADAVAHGRAPVDVLDAHEPMMT